MVECLGNGPAACPLTGACGMTGMFSEALAALFGVFDRYTLADAIERPDLRAFRLYIPGANIFQGPSPEPAPAEDAQRVASQH